MKDLPGDASRVVMRFAPNPNGPLTLGHARGVVVNSEYVNKYNGTFILRFDDTDPRVKRPILEAYTWIAEDCEWLSAKPDKIVAASERIPEYYKVAEELIKLGKAYVCSCPQDKMKRLKDAGKPCECREAVGAMELWKKMLAGKFEEKSVTLRIKTDLSNPDPALRDWVAFRIIKESHPKVGDKYVVWPMLDFEGAVEDHLLSVTHIIRGKDLADSEKRQRYVYDYLGWTYPHTLHWGRLRLADTGKFSTSSMKKSIEEGDLEGWDDPRIPTIRALARRGITPQAVRNFMIGLGLSETDIEVSMENLYAENRKVLDPSASRHFYVEDPIEVELSCVTPKTVRLPLHPREKQRGVRETTLPDGGKFTVKLSCADAETIADGERVRLIGLDSFEMKKSGGRISGKCVGGKAEKKLQWVPKEGAVDAEIVKPDGTAKGLCEPACEKLKVGDIVQFERYGFARLDSKTKDKLTFYYGHN
jgi:glutamyl-tRNA synthetase